MTEKEYIDKLIKDIPLNADEGDVWKNDDGIAIFMRYKNKDGSMFFSYNQKTNYSIDSYNEDIFVCRMCKALFEKKVKELQEAIKNIKKDTDFV